MIDNLTPVPAHKRTRNHMSFSRLTRDFFAAIASLHVVEAYTLLRIIYRTYLRQFWIIRIPFRFLVSSIQKARRWRFKIILKSPFAQKYPLIKLSDFAARFHCPAHEIEPQHGTEIKTPRFVGKLFSQRVQRKTVVVQCPKLEVYKIDKAKIVGHTHFIMSRSFAIQPDLYKADQEITTAEATGLVSISKNWDEISTYFGLRSRIFGKAVSLCGQCSGNYAHWLTETLPKLVMIDACGLYNDYPLLVDGGLHRNFYESIDILNKNRRKIYHIDRYKSASVRQLIAASLPGYTPFEARTLIESGQMREFGPDWFHFSQRALVMMRDAAWKAIPDNLNNTATRIYLRRPANQYGRRPVNQDEIESILLKYDFTIIDSGSMSLADQIDLFRKAEYIISPVGAALSNCIWSQPGCQVLCLAAYHPDLTYYPYSNLLNLLGHDMQYLLGEQIEGGDHPMHRDYYIDPASLAEILEIGQSKPDLAGNA